VELEAKEILAKLPMFDYETVGVKETINYQNPYDYFLNTKSNREGDIFLDGGDDIAGDGRFSFLLNNPLFIVTVNSGSAEFKFDGGKFRFKATPLEIISFVESLTPKQKSEGKTFDGGAVFLLPYEMGGFYENIKGLTCHDEIQLWCGFYPDALIFDNLNKTACKIFRRTPASAMPNFQKSEGFVLSNLESNESKKSYIEKINKIKTYIEKGDVYQVNLSRELEAKFNGNPLSFYGRLRKINPASYGAYLNGGDFHFLSMSPELFFSSNGKEIKTKPIKGTSHRYEDTAMDEESKTALANSGKDKAENLMIVDLMRNDISKVCKIDSVTVPALSKVKTLPTLHHLVSTVKGELKEGVRLSEILEAIFPAGSITGTPKIRAMEIIAELEKGLRNFYCGSIVTLGFNGTATGSVLIRSIVIKDGKATYRTGGAITYDSDPEEEFEETELKAKSFEMALSKEVHNV